MESLEFERPVTLIVGHNGAGKTTIIECLKMSTCGQLPPNCDKGHGFIHDPNVAGVPEVKGQIRLLFRTGVNHQHVCATRTFQLTNVRGKNGVVKSQFKALENMLRVKDKDGDDNRFSRRCADMDAIIPQLMGVSRPILEHVVFCHQEESNWPLGERMVLKKRFDEIFGSSRYTKALEAIDKRRKETAKEAKEKSHVLDLIRKDRDLAVSLTQEKNRITVSIETLSNRIIQTSQEISSAEKNLGDLEKIESESRTFLGDIERLSTQKENIENALKACKVTIDNIPTTVRDDHARFVDQTKSLIESRTSLQSQIQVSRSELQDCLNRRTDLTNRIKVLRTSVAEQSNVADLLRLKEGELAQVLEPFGSRENFSTEFLASKKTREEFVAQHTAVQAEKETNVRSLEQALMNLNHQKFAKESEITGLQNRSEKICHELNSLVNPQIASVIPPGTLPDIVESVAVQFFSDKARGVDAELDRVSMERRMLSSKSQASVLEDFKGEILREIPKKIDEKTFSNPRDMIEWLQRERAELVAQFHFTNHENTSPSQNQPDEISRINDSINNAKAAQKIYTSLGSKSVADLKCHFCRRALDNLGEFEAGINKYVSKLSAVVPELEAKRNAIAKPGCSQTHELLEKILKIENMISRISTFAKIGEMIDARISLSGSCDSNEITARVAILKARETELTREKTDLMFEKEKFFSVLRKKRELEVENSEIQARIDRMSEDGLVSIIERIGECGEMLENCRSELSGNVLNFREKISEIDSTVNSFVSTNHLIDQIQTQVDQLREKAGTSADGTLLELTRLEKEENESNEKTNELMHRLQVLESEMINMDSSIALGQSQIAIFEKQVELFEINLELEKLKSRIVLDEKINAEKIRSDIRSITSSVQQLREHRSRMEGESTQLRNQVREIDSKLASFFNIDERFRQAMIQFETESLVAKDIQRYHQALDRALMNYHVSKMNEINAVIRELWERVYKGTDIDYIAIRSDTEGEEGEGAGAAPTTKRSYNYRVVMVKGDVELEMRGRCSAGQKVLSCLIIRLALAESFCVNCGILALDEPTTNLDRANIGGLAEALAELIETRRNQKNFQLIIITHDESFVRMLGRLHACENFYRVKKDDYGHSTISRSAIYELNATTA